MSQLAIGSKITREELEKQGWKASERVKGLMGPGYLVFTRGDKAITWNAKNGLIRFMR